MDSFSFIISRGLSAEKSYQTIARNISNYGQANLNRTMRIVRTESGRIHSEATNDSIKAAKERGADIVKQWDSTLDGKTRPLHRQLDGKYCEVDEPFEVSGMKVMYPGGFGMPSEDCNCRCRIVSRARLAVEGEKTYSKMNNITGELIQCSGYKDFEKKYLNILTESDKIKTTTKNGLEVKSVSIHTLERAEKRGVSAEAIIEALENPLFIREVFIDEYGRKSQRFIGEIATVNVNSDTGVIITVWKTGKATKKKYKK